MLVYSTSLHIRLRMRMCSAIKLTFSYPSHLSGTQLCLNAAWKNWVGVRLYSIVRVFFQLRKWDMH
jgi:hypothetical protein